MKTLTSALLIICTILISAVSTAQVIEGRIIDCPGSDRIETVSYKELPAFHLPAGNKVNAGIAAMIASISEDTLKATLQELQNHGSRFLMNENRKEIAMSLVSKFLSYGYTDVRLDSFHLILNFQGTLDSSWQYNVVATVTGTSAPSEIYVIGGHYDSFCMPDPMNNAPGANDNGSAVAATLEIARVMKLHNFQPEATIQFTLFAAEELGLIGSGYAAAMAREGGADIRCMINLDMISNNPDSLPQVSVKQYTGFEWASFVAADATLLYTDLDPVLPNPSGSNPPSSDSYPYFLNGYPATYYEEYAFSPHWHKPSDTVGNCNIHYLAQITGSALATLAVQQFVPYPQELRAFSAKDAVNLRWKPTRNNSVTGYGIYRADASGGTFARIALAPGNDSVFHDFSAVQNKQYYYKLLTVNDDFGESIFTGEVTGVRFNPTESLLVLSNMKGTKITPDSIRNFYAALLDSIPYEWMDVNAVQKPRLADFSRYRNIFWISGSPEFENLNDELVQAAREFAANGGNSLFAGFSPGRLWISSNINYPVKVPDHSMMDDIFKTDTVDRKVQSMLNRAYPVSPGYPDLHTDSLKNMSKDFPGDVFMVDIVVPEQDAAVIYRFDTRYDSTTVFGKMKHRPVGTEFQGDGFVSVLLSFPLWYLDTADAKAFLRYVLMKKFDLFAGIDEDRPAGQRMTIYPNPATGRCLLHIGDAAMGPAEIFVYGIDGKKVLQQRSWIFQPGGDISLDIQNLAPGFYCVSVKSGEKQFNGKILKSQ